MFALTYARFVAMLLGRMFDNKVDVVTDTVLAYTFRMTIDLHRDMKRVLALVALTAKCRCGWSKAKRSLYFRDDFSVNNIRMTRPQLLRSMMNIGRLSHVRRRKYARSYVAIEDIVGNPTSWPRLAARARKLLYSNHLTYSGRLHLVGFLLRNGVGPELITEYLGSGTCLRDISAARHIRSIVEAWLQGHFQSNDFDLFENAFVCRARNEHLHYRTWKKQILF